MGKVSGAALAVRNSREPQEVAADGVAPHNGMSRLILESFEHIVVPLAIYFPLERFPLASESGNFLRAVVVRVVDMLNHRFPGLQQARVRHMVKEQQQLIRSPSDRLVLFSYRRPILAGVARSRRQAAVHSYSFPVRTVPLAPTIPF